MNLLTFVKRHMWHFVLFAIAISLIILCLGIILTRPISNNITTSIYTTSTVHISKKDGHDLPIVIDDLSNGLQQHDTITAPTITTTTTPETITTTTLETITITTLETITETTTTPAPTEEPTGDATPKTITVIPISDGSDKEQQQQQQEDLEDASLEWFRSKRHSDINGVNGRQSSIGQRSIDQYGALINLHINNSQQTKKGYLFPDLINIGLVNYTKVEATATCGLGIELSNEQEPREMYCQLVGGYSVFQPKHIEEVS